jgi:hypothetical protein
VRFFNAFKYFILHTNNQTINQSCISSDIHDYFPTFGQVFDPTLEKIRRFGREDIVEPIWEPSVVVEGKSEHIVGVRAKEVAIQCSKVRRVGRTWKDLLVEFLNGLFRHVCSVCVVGGCHAEKSLHVVDPGVFVGLLPP